MATDRDNAWRRLLIGHDREEQQLAVLWGKSAQRGGGKVNLLLQHLFDAMAVGGIVWDQFLALGIRRRLDEVASGEGRRLYVWLCGLHDVGKASPAFQSKVPELAERVRSAGLSWPHEHASKETWRHERASALILREMLKASWPDGREQLDWVWPMVAGHHGVFPDVRGVSIGARARDRRRRLHGDSSWVPVQELLVQIVTAAAGWPDLAAACPRLVPARAGQLALSGFITMADWIASDERHFVGVDQFENVSVAGAEERATRTWKVLGLRGGWRDPVDLSQDLFRERFGQAPRPVQQMAVETALALPAPGLLVIEAPMGEGKTEAALAAAEVLASRFGADGVYVAMPTQATSDAMYDRVREWLATFDGRPAVALLHGRRRISDLIRTRASRPDSSVALDSLDFYGMVDDPPSFASVCEDRTGEEEVDRPVEWFLGRHRGLLTANGVGTIDQALYAGSRTKYVALRYAGLAGKVVIFDEVHAADDYMAQFLAEVLHWLGNGRVPVVLLSATLAPAQRDRLVGSYLEGATLATSTEPMPVPFRSGYPSVLAASVSDQVHYEQRSVRPWRPSLEVGVSLCDEDPPGTATPIVAALRERLADGGCALVIRNTVARAQDAFRELEAVFGDDLVLLHSRFTSNTRAETTQRLLDLLGPDSRARPKRLVVVATQVAEQSFDVDADFLVTDLAPIDLMLQRAGRLHRHQRPITVRPPFLRRPQIVVSGLRLGDGLPWFPGGSKAVYGRHLLLRSAALVLEAIGGRGWSVPADVPGLVARAYNDEPLVPDGWADDAARAAEEWRAEVTKRANGAVDYLLAAPTQRYAPTLGGLHLWGGLKAESHVKVRDGDMGEEVILVVGSGGEWSTVDGVRLGPQGDAARDRPEAVLGASIRLPIRDEALSREVNGLSPLPGWRDDPWLGSARALCLDRDGRAEIAGYRLAYDQKLGLTMERSRR